LITIFRIKILRFLALDVAAGAVAGSLFLAQTLGIRIRIDYCLILFLAVIVIYSSDHLMDGFRKRGNSESEVHSFFIFTEPLHW